ncbi:MAG: HupE/UreJ family protein, partial [Vicinamibacteraceae bacterium]
LKAPRYVRRRSRPVAMNIRNLLPAVLLLALPASVAAHPSPFSYLDLYLGAASAHGSLVVHDLDVAHELRITPPERLLDPAVARAYRDRIAALLATRLRLTLDGRPMTPEWRDIQPLVDRQSLRLTFRLAAARPASVQIDALLFPYDPIHQTYVNLYDDDALVHQAILDVREQKLVYYAGTIQGTLAVMATFVPSGIEHILIGPDHVLFLVGLLLLGGTLWRLAGIVSAFTLGHSVTLSLAALDLVSPPSSIVEPTIALSIVFVGADNLLVARARSAGGALAHASTGARDIRPWIAAIFGLVHGFEFAAVLREFGLPRAALGWSLFSFNLGVEIGQLAIVLVVALALDAVRRHSLRLGERLTLAGSIGVILAGAYWFVERVF